MAPLKVLLAEDNIVNQRLALALLERRNALVTVANNGCEAVERWSEGSFDLILMDIQMPEVDGLEATRTIRSREGDGWHVPIVALTARAMTGDREECMAAGMDGYLSKPIRSADLMVIIDRMTVAATGPETPAEAGPAFDLAKLQNLVGDDHALVAELIGLFATEAPTYVAAICRSHAVHDRQGMRDAAHTLKGSANAITALHVGLAAEHIEVAARSGDLDAIAPAIAELQKELANLEAHFRELGFRVALAA